MIVFLGSKPLKYHMMACVKCVQHVQLIRGDMLYLYIPASLKVASNSC